MNPLDIRAFEQMSGNSVFAYSDTWIAKLHSGDQLPDGFWSLWTRVDELSDYHIAACINMISASDTQRDGSYCRKYLDHPSWAVRCATVNALHRVSDPVPADIAALRAFSARHNGIVDDYVNDLEKRSKAI